MKTISRTFFQMRVITLYFVLIPLFWFFFILLYNPFGIDDFLAVGKDRYTLNLILSSVIVLGSMLLSRMLLFLLRNTVEFTPWAYLAWCGGEVLFTGAMLSILLGIGWAGEIPYFSVLIRCVEYLLGILLYPYVFIAMVVQLEDSSKYSMQPLPDEKTLIRFCDDQKRLKLVISSDAVYYIEADENYAHILYLDNGHVKDFSLRTSMRSLEDLLEKHPLVRCHRSFFVNPSHVTLVRKDTAGYALAQLDLPALKQIPVSRRYYQVLTSLL